MRSFFFDLSRGRNILTFFVDTYLRGGKGTDWENASVVGTVIGTASIRERIMAFNYASEALNNSFFLSALVCSSHRSLLPHPLKWEKLNAVNETRPLHLTIPDPRPPSSNKHLLKPFHIHDKLRRTGPSPESIRFPRRSQIPFQRRRNGYGRIGLDMVGHGR